MVNSGITVSGAELPFRYTSLVLMLGLGLQGFGLLGLGLLGRLLLGLGLLDAYLIGLFECSE